MTARNGKMLDRAKLDRANDMVPLMRSGIDQSVLVFSGLQSAKCAKCSVQCVPSDNLYKGAVLMKKENTAVQPGAILTVSRPRSTAQRTIPLSMVRSGESVVIKSISGKDETKRFLSNLGFVEDVSVSVVSEMHGNVIVSIKGTRLAISKAMANRVLTA